MGRTSRRIVGKLAVMLVAMLAVTACSSMGGGGGSQAPGSGNTYGPNNRAKFVVGGVTANAGNWPVQIGVEQGIFKKWGLDVDFVFAPTGLANVAALLGGSVNAASTTYDAGIAAQLEAPELKWVVDGYNRLPYQLITPANITNIEQLRGQTCGAQSQNTVDGLYLRLLIDAASKGAMVYDKDYKIQVLGAAGAAPKLAALNTQQISCVAVIPPDTGILTAAGNKVLYKVEQGTDLYKLPFAGYVMDQTWYSKNREAAERFAAAMIESVIWLYEPANKDAAIALLAKNAKLTPEVATQAYEWVGIGGYPRNPTVTQEQVQAMISTQQKFGVFTLFRKEVPSLIDTSIVEGAMKRLPADLKAKAEAK